MRLRTLKEGNVEEKRKMMMGKERRDKFKEEEYNERLSRK